jgi:predicted nuclease of predicted toxin-antitoxin system
MKIKLDENLPADLAPSLAAMGHDIETVLNEGIAGRSDLTVWETTQREKRFLITQDMDFSDLRRYIPGTHHGILLVRLKTPSRRALAARVADLFGQEDASRWARCFVVPTESKVRIRRPRELP